MKQLMWNLCSVCLLAISMRSDVKGATMALLIMAIIAGILGYQARYIPRNRYRKAPFFKRILTKV